MILLHHLTAKNFKQLAEIDLTFPDSGTILIEGHNEAGKSSLFEAVYFALFGKPLHSKVKIPELKSYNADYMQVELGFSVDGRRFRVTRSVRSQQSVMLWAPTPEGKEEKITGSEAGRRIQQELAMSDQTLLNTCFVEQKKLEQLESLDAEKRQATINELLNIRELTVLEAQFKVERRDQDEVSRTRTRLEIARLDRELPDIERLAETAQLCWLYRQILDNNAHHAELESQIVTSSKERKQIAQRLAEIKTILQNWEKLQRQIQSVRNDLPLHNRGWKEAIRVYDERKEQEKTLLNLRASLPARQEFLQSGRAMAADLRQLDDLLADAQELDAVRTARLENLNAYKKLTTEWEAGERQRVAQIEQVASKQREYDEIRTRWQERQSTNQRNGRLDLLHQRLEQSASLTDDISELRRKRQLAEELAATVPQLQTRLQELENLEKLLKQLEGDRHTLRQTESELAGTRQRLSDFENVRTQRATTEEAIASNVPLLARSQESEIQAKNALDGVTLRLALLEWAEAAERCAEADPNSGKLAEIEARQGEIAKRLKAATEQAETAKHKMRPGMIAIGAGALLTVIAFATPFLIPLMVVGITISIVGGILVQRARQNAITAQIAQTEAQAELHRVAGERSALEGIVLAFATQLTRRQEEEATQRQVLANLLDHFPATPTAARAHATELPVQFLDVAREAYDTARQKRERLEDQQQDLKTRAKVQHDRLIQLDGVTILATVDRLEQQQLQRQTALKQTIVEMTSLSDMLKLESDPDTDIQPLRRALKTTRDNLAGAQHAEQQIAEIDTDIAAKNVQQQNLENQIDGMVEELDLRSIERVSLPEAVARERKMHADTLIRLPDEALHKTLETADDALKAVQTALNILQNKQEERSTLLALEDPLRLQTLVQEVVAQQAVNTQAQELLWPVISRLQVAQLPVETPALQTALSLLQREIELDERRIATLSDVQASVETAQQDIQQRSQELKTAWEAQLPSVPLPSTPEEVATQLPQIDRDLTAQADALQQAKHLTEQQNLQQRDIELGEEIATRRDNQRRVRQDNLQLFTDIGIEASEIEKADGNAIGTNVAIVEEHFPELVEALQMSIEAWQQEMNVRRNRVQDARIERRTKAKNLYLDETPLVLEEETQSHATAVQELEIKRRATTIVQNTRKAIVDRVMPMTLDNARYLLPALTQGRYQDLEWDTASNLVRVYDSRAGAYQGKFVFSGGAKDQISLALRLGFALATLPTGKTTRPYWLFLDEPLSSFDRERTRALVDLLTKGVVRKHFHQIFLVSHSESFDPNLFEYRLRMENGCVVENTLPMV